MASTVPKSDSSRVGLKLFCISEVVVGVALNMVDDGLVVGRIASAVAGTGE